MLGWRQRKEIIHTSPWRTQRKQPLLEHSLPCVKYTYVPTTVSLNISLRERNLCSDTNLYTIHCTNICNSPQNQIQQKCPSMGKWIKNKTNLFFFLSSISYPESKQTNMVDATTIRMNCQKIVCGDKSQYQL